MYVLIYIYIYYPLMLTECISILKSLPSDIVYMYTLIIYIQYPLITCTGIHS